MISYEIHPIARLIPPLTPTQLIDLKQDIAKNGLIEPIKIWRGQILDGRHRYEICGHLGVEPQFEVLPDDIDPHNYVKSTNLMRRHIEEDLRITLSLELDKGSRRSMGRPTNNDTEGSTTQEAQDLGVSRTKLTKAKMVQDNAPELFTAIIETGVSINEAYDLKDKPAEITQEAVEKYKEGGYKSLKHAVRETERGIGREAMAAIARETPVDDRMELYGKPIKDLASVVKPESVDLIITDPPYDMEAVPLFKDLRDFAVHALKPGGQLVVMSGCLYMDAKMAYLAHDELVFRTAVAYYMAGPCIDDYKFKVHLRTKPLLVYGKYGQFERFIDSFLTYEGETREDELHHWGQSVTGMDAILKMFAKENDIVCDPFLGSGTTGLVAVKAGHYFIGGDIDQSNIEVSRGRIIEGAGKWNTKN